MEHPSLPFEPRARHSDPEPAHLAAESVKPVNARLLMAIRRYVYEAGASTSFQIADALLPEFPQLQPDTIRTAVSRAKLKKWPGGTSPGGRPACLYGHTGTIVPTNGRT